MLYVVKLCLILKRVDNDIVNDIFRAELRREEHCKYELIEHPVPGGQKILGTSYLKRDTMHVKRDVNFWQLLGIL